MFRSMIVDKVERIYFNNIQAAFTHVADEELADLLQAGHNATTKEKKEALFKFVANFLTEVAH